MSLLHALGYGLELDGGRRRPASRCAPERSYVFEARARACAPRRSSDPDADVYSGRDLISLREHVLDDDGSLRAAQRLLGRVLRALSRRAAAQSRLVLQDIVSRGL